MANPLTGKIPKIDTLNDLIQALRIVFEDDNVNIELVNGLMKAYESNPLDWKKFAKFDKFRPPPFLLPRTSPRSLLPVPISYEAAPTMRSPDMPNSFVYSSSINFQVDVTFMKVTFVMEEPSIFHSNPLLGESRYFPADFILSLIHILPSTPKVYTRNLVDEGNGKYNLMLLCWDVAQGSAIHDHSSAHCFMKVIYGQLDEVRFAWPEGDHPLAEISRNHLPNNSVCYINDSLGLHRVENPSSSDVAVSLHLYCPPFGECSVFNQQTGKRTVCKVTFWSKYGKRPDRKHQEERPPEDN
ncbi:unnamed protein product [Nezara viridula]|uniref:Cysteine dioxygenase n=1 Tax=Nezara viridula TaxID=85310 RepID=A0A9P0MR72_NEZVI|nr:unnamed protein product [Nezara viridula]